MRRYRKLILVSCTIGALIAPATAPGQDPVPQPAIQSAR
jgi:hypothetical protein